VDPSAAMEVRDRGLLAYHLNDFPAALHDLQHYLQLVSQRQVDDEEKQEQDQIWEHIKSIKRKMASNN
jgi:regulator of sirC expression with transglutaminase-like and TPR domain